MFTSITPLITYNGDGSDTSYPVPCPFYDPADVKVWTIMGGVEVELSNPADFTVEITNIEKIQPGLMTGNVVLTGLAPGVGVDITIGVWPNADQDQRYQGVPVTQRQQERVQDRHAMRDAFLRELATRGFRSPLNTAPGLRYIAVGAAGTVAIFDGLGNLIEGPDAGDIVLAQQYATAAAAAAAAAIAAAATINLPAIAPGDALKILQVKPDLSGYQLGAAFDPIVDEPDLGLGLAQALETIVFSRAEMKGLNTLRHKVAFLAINGQEGKHIWRGVNMSAQMVRQTRTSAVIAATDTITQDVVTSTSVDATTDTITVASGVPFTEGQEIIARNTADGVQINGQYFAKNVTATTFQIAVRPTAGPFNLTGTTNLTFSGVNKLDTGEAIAPTATGHNLTIDVPVYVIRTGPGTFKVATTYLNARAGIAIDLSTDGPITWRQIADPMGGRFITPNGADIGGSAGAWERVDDVVNAQHFGALNNGLDVSGALNAWALQAASFLGRYLRKPTVFPGGPLSYKTDYGLEHNTDDPLYASLPIQSAYNGVKWWGDGRELSTIEASANFPDNGFLFKHDGNMNGLAKVVGSRPKAQTNNHIRGIRFKGRVDPVTGNILGTNVRGAYVRGCWEPLWEDVDFEGFSGNMVVADSAGLTNPDDESDNTQFWTWKRSRLTYGLAGGFQAIKARFAVLHMQDVEFYGLEGTGMQACLVNSLLDNVAATDCGNRTDVTTGGIRLEDAQTGSLCRNNTLVACKSEANFNYEFNFIGCRGLTMIEPNLNIYEPPGGVVANKAGIRIGSAGAGTTRDIKIIGGYFPEYSVTYDVPYIDIAAGVEGVSVEGAVMMHATAHIKAASPVRLVLDKMAAKNNTQLLLTGAAPVASYQNYTPL